MAHLGILDVLLLWRLILNYWTCATSLEAEFRAQLVVIVADAMMPSLVRAQGSKLLLNASRSHSRMNRGNQRHLRHWLRS